MDDFPQDERKPQEEQSESKRDNRSYPVAGEHPIAAKQQRRQLHTGNNPDQLIKRPPERAIAFLSGLIGFYVLFRVFVVDERVERTEEHHNRKCDSEDMRPVGDVTQDKATNKLTQ